VSPREDVHLDAELIALMAMGERPGTPEESAEAERHIAACGYCSSELDELSAVARSARALGPEDSLVAPPPEVWAAISAELAPAATVTVLDDRRGRRRPLPWLPVVAAACLGLVVGGGATYAAMNGEQQPASPSVIASAALDPLEGSSAQGTVEVVQTADGPQVLVDVTGLTKNAEGFYEVWLLDKDAQKLIALGVLDSADKGVFAMPPGVSMSDFPVVDVSFEPQDGDPGHSKQSLVRGVLPA